MRLAAQLLSASTAAAIRELFEGEEAAAEVCEVIDAGFDVLNSRTLFSDKPLRCGLGATEHWERQKAALERLHQLMATARFGSSGSGLLPCQKGFIVSVRSTLSLFEELRQVAGFSFLLTARLNQDALESFFSTVRARFGSNLNPSPVEFLQRVRLLLIGADPAAARGTAVQPECAAPATFLQATRQPQSADEADTISSVLAARVCEPTGDEEAEPGEEPEKLESELVSAADIPVEVIEECQLALDGEPTEASSDPAVQAQSYGAAYAAGFLAAKCARTDPSLGMRTADADEEEVPSDARWVTLLSRGGLTVPSRQWLGVFREMDATFCALHQGKGRPRRNEGKQMDNLSREPGVVGGLVELLRERWPRLDAKVVAAYAQLRTRFRLRHVAQLRRCDHAAALRDAAARRKTASRPLSGSATQPLSSRVIRKRRQLHRGSAHV